MLDSFSNNKVQNLPFLLILVSAVFCPEVVSVIRRKIGQIESNAKYRHLKKLTCKGTLRQVFICLRPPSPPSSFWGGLAILLVLNLVRYRVLNS